MCHIGLVAAVNGRKEVSPRISSARIASTTPASAAPISVGRPVLYRAAPPGRIPPMHGVKAASIREPERIAVGVGVGVGPAVQPNRIGLNVPPDKRGIGARAIVVEGAFEVPFLSGQSQILHDGACAGSRIAERLISG